MKLAVFSDLAIWRSGEAFLAAPSGDALEIRALAGLSESVRLVGLAAEGPAPPHAVELDPRLEVFTAEVSGGPGARGKLRALGGCLQAAPALDRALAQADMVQLRCPSKLAWAALALLTPRLDRPRVWARWGGQAEAWPGEPPSYRLQRLALRVGVAGARTTVVGPGGLPNPTRSAAQLAAADRRTQDKRLQDPLRLLFAARLSQDKGGDTVVAATAGLAHRGRPVRLDIAGDGPERPRLEAAVRRLGLESAVVFHGWLGAEALDALAEQAHFALLPSRTEGFPRALHEAMAFRAVPLASPAGAIPQTLTRVDPQLLLPADRPQRWADRIERIAARPAEWRRLADASREIAAACSAEAYREAVLDFWERTWGCNRPASAWEAAR